MIYIKRVYVYSFDLSKRWFWAKKRADLIARKQTVVIVNLFVAFM